MADVRPGENPRTSGEIIIREIAPGDRDAVLALAPRLLEGVAPWRDAAAVLATVQGWIAAAADATGQPDRAVYVAVDGDQVVGIVTAAEHTHWTGQVDVYVGELITAAGHERRGVARRLMAAVEAWGAQRGLKFLTLETGAANHTARAFYAALGYQEEGVRLTKAIGDA
jgi:ribosomal protein S18 acetylase RimI-like enzyme